MALFSEPQGQHAIPCYEHFEPYEGLFLHVDWVQGGEENTTGTTGELMPLRLPMFHWFVGLNERTIWACLSGSQQESRLVPGHFAAPRNICLGTTPITPPLIKTGCLNADIKDSSGDNCSPHPWRLLCGTVTARSSRAPIYWCRLRVVMPEHFWQAHQRYPSGRC